MIRYALRCDRGHGFEAWFRDSAAYDDQRAGKLVACAVCGGTEVEKALMAPAVGRRSRGPDQPPAQAPEQPREMEAGSAPDAPAPDAPAPALSAPAPAPVMRALAELRARIEKTSDYVGDRFAREARARHLQGETARPVWGEATAEEARALVEDGVPVAPLPFLPRRDD